MNTTAAKIPPITMSKLYIGNLPTETTENALRQLFVEQNLSATNILVKRGGYAFVDCPDQSSADKAIDKLNGKVYKMYKYLLCQTTRLTLYFRLSHDQTSCRTHALSHICHVIRVLNVRILKTTNKYA